MKSILLSLLLVMCGATGVAQAKIASAEFTLEQDVNLEEEIKKLFDAEMANKNSVLSLALIGFAKQNEAVLEYDNDSPVQYVDVSNLILVYTGRSGPSAGTTLLSPIMLSFPGTGLIEEIAGWLVIKTEINLEDEIYKIWIEGIQPFSLNP